MPPSGSASSSTIDGYSMLYKTAGCGPAPQDAGLLVGVNGHFRDDEEQAGNRIRVWVQVDIDKLPRSGSRYAS